MTADDKLDMLIEHYKLKITNSETIRILTSLKSENMEKWMYVEVYESPEVMFGRDLAFDSVEKMIVGELEK